MNFEGFYEWIQQYQYDEIRIIGRDAILRKKPAHVAAMMRKGDQVELCVLLQDAPKKEPEIQDYTQQSRTNRELMEQSRLCRSWPFIRQLKVDGLVLESLGESMGTLNTGDLGGMYLMAKLTDAGWRLPEDHMFYHQDWEQQPIQLMHSRFCCTSESLPDLERANVRAIWNVCPVWYQIGKPVELAIEDTVKDEEGQTKITFTLDEPDGTVQEGICYINRVTLQDMWEVEEQRFADPQYQKQMLECMSQEEFLSMKQQSFQVLEQMCPRGMCLPVVEYECTLDAGLEFYTQDYLNAPPVCRSSSAIYLSKPEQEQGKHGLPLKSVVLQSPVPPDTQKMQAELFQAVRTEPEWEEEWTFGNPDAKER